MTDATLVRLVREHFEGLFPKSCSRCGRRFDTLRDYIRQTQRLGPAMSYDVEEGNWAPAEPLGTLVVSNCPAAPLSRFPPRACHCPGSMPDSTG